MSFKLSLRRLLLILLPVLGLALGVAWYIGAVGQFSGRPPQNSILVIAPYQYNGAWVFDDERFGLVREPFVGGVPKMIDVLVANIPDAKEGFRLTFASQPFPGYDNKLTWLRGDMGGNYYRLDHPRMEGWICPALFKYYDRAPKELYVKAEPKG